MDLLVVMKKLESNGDLIKELYLNEGKEAIQRLYYAPYHIVYSSKTFTEDEGKFLCEYETKINAILEIPEGDSALFDFD